MAGLREPDDSGFSLIELLVATAIMGSAVIALVTGMGTLINSSSQSREATTAAIVARSYAEGLEVAVAQAGDWCSSYTVSYAQPAGYPVTATADPCPNATTAQFRKVAISVATPSGAAETLTVVVRKP